eukprot:m.134568 g.134568  ORF g.134568 m.134568 type:complete len:409 (-) comp9642_c0_seq1:2276-3502(-)
MGEVFEYFNRVRNAFLQEDGKEFALLLSLRNMDIVGSFQSLGFLQIDVETQKQLEGDLNNMWKAVSSHLHAVATLHESTLKDAFYHKLQCCKELRNFVADLQGVVWPLKAFEQCFFDLRLLFTRFRRSLGEEPGDACGKEETNLAESALNLMFQETIRALNNDRTEGSVSKKMYIMPITNHLFALAFQTKKFAFLKQGMTTVDKCNKQSKKAHLVTYNYYRARYLVMEQNYRKARSYLQIAYRECPNYSTKNLQLILTLLILVSLLEGVYPQEDMVLPEFVRIIRAIKMGNLCEYKDALRENQKFFIRCSVYSLVEKLKQRTLRNLFKRAYDLLPNKQLLQISQFTRALNISAKPQEGEEQADDVIDWEYEDDETECVFVDLIASKLIKGRIEFNRKIVVLKKESPFI